MRKIILTTVLSALIFGYVGFIIGKSTTTSSKVFSKKNTTTSSLITVDKTKSLCLMFADTVDGRPIYTVMFNDTTVLDAMYPEEIASGLLSGKWEYDEDLKLSSN